MTSIDDLIGMLSQETPSLSLSALRLPVHLGIDDADNARANDAILKLFEMLGRIVHRDSDLHDAIGANASDPTDPSWYEAYDEVVTLIVWVLKSRGYEKPPIAHLRLIGSPEEAGLPSEVRYERSLIFSFVLALGMAEAMAITAGLRGLIPLHADLTVFDMLSALTSAPSPWSKAGAAMANYVSESARHYSQMGEDKERDRLKATADSLLQKGEFHFLASRAPWLLEKYGERNVSRRFEQQLSRALQLLGFLTVSAGPGTRQGDIICITARPEPRAMLAEAKTSKHPYNLPADDERALVEYARELKNPDKFHYKAQLICIFGPEPAPNLANRLANLEASAGIAIRYCSASAFTAMLMAPHVGVTPDDVIEALLRSDRIVARDHLLAISSNAQTRVKSLESHIRLYGGFR